MANKKFSEFELKTTTSNVSHIVGYNGAENVRITPANFVTGGGTGVFLPLAGGTMVGNTIHNDNVKSIYGAGSDLQIYHSGTNSFIKDVGTGVLEISTDGAEIQMNGNSGAEYMLRAISDAGIKLYFDSSLKLETTSTGISVTGGGTFTGFVGIGGAADNLLTLQGTAGDTHQRFKEGSTTIGFIGGATGIIGSQDGKLAIRAEAGLVLSSQGNFADVVIDSGNSTFAGDVSVGSGKFLRFPTAGGTGGNATIDYDISAFTFTSNNVSAPMIFKTSSAEKMRLDASGNLCIALTSSNYKVGVNGDVGISNSSKLFIGGVGADAVIGSLGSDSGVFTLKSDGNRDISIGSDTQAIFIEGSNGNLGIGTSNPSSTLQVGEATNTVGALDALVEFVVDAPDNTSVTNVLNLISKFNGSPAAVAGSGPALLFSGGIGDAQTRTYAKIVGNYEAGNAGGLSFQTQDSADIITEKMVIKSITGNVGIGTDSPADKLSISSSTNQIGLDTGDIAADGTLDIGQFSNGAFIGTQLGTNATADILRFGTSSTERMRINSAGNVGVGMTSGFNAVSGTETTVGILNSNVASLYLQSTGTNGKKYGIYSASSGQLAFYDFTDGSERMRLTSNGDLLIGKTVDNDNTVGARIVGTGLISATRSGNAVAIFDRTTSNGNLVLFRRGSTQVGSISVNTTTTTYNTSSDYRLKEDLQDFKGLDLVSKIPVYDYKWKSSNDRGYGVMAHQLQEVLPQAVSGEKDAEEMQSVDYSKIVPLLVKSIQELKAEIELLKNK